METTYHIVVGVDGSNDSLRALRWALGEAHRRGGTVQAVTAYTWLGTEAAMLAGLSPDAERQRAETLLAASVEEVLGEFPDMSVAAEVIEGEPGPKLTEVARDADLLVVGSHGHGRLHHAVLGSVSEACIRLAGCPVVVIPLPRPHPGHATELARADQPNDESGTATTGHADRRSTA
jgi:nucleotide-binding universal stress UspA family protein